MKARAIPLLPLWVVLFVQSLSACTRVQFTSTFYKGFERTCYLHLPWRFWQKLFTRLWYLSTGQTWYRSSVMSIAVTTHKIYHNVLLFAPVSRVDLVKRLQFLTPQAGGNEQTCNTSEGEHLVLKEVQCKRYFFLCRHKSIFQLLSHTNKNTWNDQIPPRYVACRSQSNKWQSMFLLSFLFHSRIVMKWNKSHNAGP